MDKLAALTPCPLFELLSPAELEHLARLAQERSCAAGEVLLQEGQPGDSLFVLVRGQWAVLGGEGADARRLTLLGPPECVGEMSIIDREHRSATVRAVTDGVVLELPLAALATFRQSHRDAFTFLIINIARTLSARLREANARLARLGEDAPR